MATITKRARKGATTYQVKIRLDAGSAGATFTKRTDAKAWAAETEGKAPLTANRYLAALSKTLRLAVKLG